MLKKIIIAVATVASMAAIVPAQARGLDDGYLSIHFDTNPVRVVHPVRVYEPAHVYQTDWREGRRDYYNDHRYYRYDRYRGHYDRHDRDDKRDDRHEDRRH